MSFLTEKFDSYLRNELRRSPLTAEAYCRDVNAFASWLSPGNPDSLVATDVAVNDVRSWIASLMASGCEPRSVRRKLQSLRAFFRYMMKSEGIPSNPAMAIPLPKIPKRLPEVIKAEEVERVLEDSESLISGNPEDEALMRDNLIIEILYSLGLRRAELIAISDPDISISSGEIKIHGKRDKDRVVPVPAPLLHKIRCWQILRDSLWPGLPEPRPLLVAKGKRISPSQVYLAVKRSLAGVASGKKSPHALRHSFATSMLNEGAEINSVKEFLGHASLATTQIYTHVSFAEMKKAYDSAHPRAEKK